MSDAERIFQLVEQNREYLAKWLPWVSDTKSVEDSKTFLESVEANHTSRNGIHCGIVVREQLVGLIGLRFVSGEYTANIGYWLSAHVSGLGLVTRSVRRICQYGFEDLNLQRIEIRAATENGRSWQIAERLGFTREGKLRHCEKIADQFLDHYMYSLIRTDKVDWR
jgi:ribosomal-protein-serine acetyltransferase